MNKAQLVEAIADRLGGRTEAEEAVDAVFDVIVRTVVKGEQVSITGFGVFEKAARAARQARNPRTGETFRLGKTAVPRFRPGQNFKRLTSRQLRMPHKSIPAFRKAPKGTYS